MLVEKGKKEYVKNFLKAAKSTWGSEVNELEGALKATAEAVWYVDGIHLEPETEPAVLPKMRSYTEEE